MSPTLPRDGSAGSPSSLSSPLSSKKAKKKVRREYTAADVKLLKAHSKARTPVAKLTKLMKRSEGSLSAKGISARNWSRPSAIELNPTRYRKQPCFFCSH